MSTNNIFIRLVYLAYISPPVIGYVYFKGLLNRFI